MQGWPTDRPARRATTYIVGCLRWSLPEAWKHIHGRTGVRIPNSLRRLLPWEGRPSGPDIVLLTAIGSVLVLGIVVRPLTPFLVARHPAARALALRRAEATHLRATVVR